MNSHILKTLRVSFAVIPMLSMLALTGCGGASQTPSNTDTTATVVTYHDGDLHVVGQKGNMHFETYDGKQAFNGATFYFARDFYMGYAPVTKMVDGKELHGMLNLQGEEAIPIQHEASLDIYDEGYFEISGKVNDRYLHGYLDSTGKSAVPMVYNGTKGAYNGLFVMEKDLKYGVVDHTGKEITPFIYHDVLGFAENGLMAVEKDYKWGFIDRSGKEVIPCMYASASSFEGDVTIARKDKLYGLIGPHNEAITPMEFDEFKFETTAVADAGSETGFSDVGKRLITEDGHIVVRKGKMWGAIDPKGQIVIPFEFDYLGASDANGVNVGLGDKRGVWHLDKKAVEWYGQK